MRYVSAFLAERAVWPAGWETVKATAVVLARQAELAAAVASDAAQTSVQPAYPLLVEDMAVALGYRENTEVPW